VDHNKPYLPAIILTLLSLATTAQADDASLKLGPAFSISVPNTLSIGVIAEPTQYNGEIRGSLQVGYVPVPFLKKGELAISSIEASSEWHFLHNAVFAGLALGYQQIRFGTTINFSSMGDAPSEVEFLIRDLYLTPLIGLAWKMPSGLYISTSAGIQLPLLTGGGLTITSTTDSSMEKRESFERAADGPIEYYASLKKPYVTLITIGWFF
jgi:hypothetical protein